ncbi:MAG: F0F1 ATP synthase subunit A [Bacteroidales bacterium]|nr:F0F1 ATP synthase subunit A [Bacteroidales bacterium]
MKIHTFLIMNNSHLLRISTFFIILLFLSPGVMAAGEKSNDKGEEFNAGRMIIEHIIDNHEWHIMDFGHTHISVPLPVILYYEGKLDVFMSSGFDHGHSSHKGYKIESEGENKGKIVRVVPGTMETDAEATVPVDFSITKNVLAVFISIILLSLIFISVGNAYKRRGHDAPRGLQSLLEPVILFIRDDVAKSSIGEKRYERYLPYLLTLFFFIFFNNLLGLIPIFPGGANLTGNLAVTGVMAVFTFIITTFSGNKNYWKHIFNTPGVPWWLKIPVPLMPVVEIMGLFTKPFVLMVRLFANITAGHIIILGFVSLIFIFGNINAGLGYGVSVVSIAFMIFMGLLELLVAFIQAYVFTLLSALYFGMATEEHH